jgi:hypothetical protein
MAIKIMISAQLSLFQNNRFRFYWIYFVVLIMCLILIFLSFRRKTFKRILLAVVFTTFAFYSLCTLSGSVKLYAFSVSLNPFTSYCNSVIFKGYRDGMLMTQTKNPVISIDGQIPMELFYCTEKIGPFYLSKYFGGG